MGGGGAVRFGDGVGPLTPSESPRLRRSGASFARVGLGEFWDFEAFAIVPVEHSVCGFVADEALCFRVDSEVCAERERRGGEVYRVLAEMFSHSTEGFGQFCVVADRGFDFVDRRVFAQAVGNVGDVAEGCGDVSFLALAGEGRAVPAANRFEEVCRVGFRFALGVRCGAVLWPFVSAEGVDEFPAVVVSEHGGVARDEDVSVFVLENDADFGASVVIHFLGILCGRQSSDFEVEGCLFVAVGDGLGVRGFAVIHVTESSTDADDGSGELFFAEEPAGDVGLVDALITEVAVAVVPDPVPVVVKFFAEDVDFWGGSAPEVEV